MKRSAPSILSGGFLRFSEEVENLEAAGADLLPSDVMDNHCVPNLTIGPMACDAIRSRVTIPVDEHPIVTPVDELEQSFTAAGAGIISFHPEASLHLVRALALIRGLEC